jgi:hypothetical protein
MPGLNTATARLRDEDILREPPCRFPAPTRSRGPNGPQPIAAPKDSASSTVQIHVEDVAAGHSASIRIGEVLAVGANA